MSRVFRFLKKKEVYLYLIAAAVIIFDVFSTSYCDEFIKIPVNYILVPVLAVFSILNRHKSYFILLIYEIFISMLIIIESSVFSVFTWFLAHDLWHIIKSLYIDISYLGIPIWFQPIIVFIAVSIPAIIFTVKRNKKS